MGESETFEGASEFMESHGVLVVDLNNDECKKLMSEFIRKHPKLWNEDIRKL